MARQYSNIDSGRQLKLLIIAGSEKGCTQKVFLKSSKYNTGNGEVALYLIIKISSYSNIAYKVEDNLIDDKRSYNGHPNLPK